MSADLEAVQCGRVTSNRTVTGYRPGRGQTYPTLRSATRDGGSKPVMPRVLRRRRLSGPAPARVYLPGCLPGRSRAVVGGVGSCAA